MVKKDILKVIFMLISINRNIFSKKQDLISLSSIKIEAITILNILRKLSSIFRKLISVFCIGKLSFSRKLDYIILTLLSKLIRASIIYGQN